MTVEEDIGGISNDEKYIEREHIKNLGEIFLNKKEEKKISGICALFLNGLKDLE